MGKGWLGTLVDTGAGVEAGVGCVAGATGCTGGLPPSALGGAAI